MKDNFKKNKGIVIFFALFICVISICVGCVIWMMQGPFSMSVSDANSYINYDNVVYELSAEGKDYEATLGCGTYKVGVHIPEGKYAIELLSGACRIVLNDEKNKIHVDSRVRQVGEAETTGSIADAYMEDIRLYDGMIMELYSISEINTVEEVKLNFKTKNAQLPLRYMENPNVEEEIITDTIIVGVNIPAGVYDLCCSSGSGYIYLSQMDDESWKELIDAGAINAGFNEWKKNFIESIKSLRQYSMSTEVHNTIYKNVVLTERMILELDEGMEIILTPSEVIESENYEDFF